jgi:ribosomal-protein-alanine N-acetyltransferase
VNETLETPRLRLRPLVPGDLDRLTAIWTDPEVARLLVTRPKDRAEVAERLAGLIELARGFGMWGVELRATGELIGRCGFYPWAPGGAAPEPELAYLLARAHWGRGLASEAARAALDALFRRVDPARVVALVRPEHAASRRVLEKLGMLEAERHTVSGVDVLFYELLRR